MRRFGAILILLIVTATPVICQGPPILGNWERPPIVKMTRESPDARKTTMKEILAREEFSGSQKSAADQWLGSLLRRAPVFDGFGSGEGSKAVSITLSIIVLVLFLLLLAHVLARLGLGRLLGSQSMETEDIYAGPDSPRGALDEASRAASSGDFRTALRLVYLAVLLRLDERDLIRFDRTGTNWEYLAALRGNPEFHQLLRPVTVTFDRKWYGREAAGESDYTTFVEAYAAAEALEVGQ